MGIRIYASLRLPSVLMTHYVFAGVMRKAALDYYEI